MKLAIKYKLNKNIEIIDLLGCEIGLIKPGELSYSERFLNEMKAHGYKKLRVNTFSSDNFIAGADNSLVAMRLVVQPAVGIIIISGFNESQYERYKQIEQSYTTLEGELAKAKYTLSKLDSENPKYQAAQHELLTSAIATKIAHEVDPENQVGCMLAARTNYAYSCKPEDVWVAKKADRKRRKNHLIGTKKSH